MNKLPAVVFAGLMTLSGISQANPNHHNHGHYHRHSGEWIAPLVIGSVVGYAIATRPQPAPPQVVYYPNTYPPVPVGYRWDQVLDANCNCYRWVLVPN